MTRTIGMVFALVAGAAIAWVDSRPTWDDTGVSAALVFFAAALASVLRVRPVLAIVFVAGPLIAVSLVHGDNGGLLAGFIAALGALIGAKLRAGRDRT